MARVKAIRQALVDSLGSAPALAAVTRWHKVDGILPGRLAGKATGSVGAGRTTYQEQDAEWDLASTDLPVFIAIVDPDPERAEDVVQELGEEARLHLVVDDPTLGGLVQRVDVGAIDFTTAEADGNLLVHFITMQVSVSHFAPRFRNDATPPADELVVQIDPDGGAEP